MDIRSYIGHYRIIFSSNNIYFLWSANAELYQLRLCVYECIICAMALCRVVWGAKDEDGISQVGAL